MNRDRLPDLWLTRDFPVLLEQARRIEAGDDADGWPPITEVLSLDAAAIERATAALIDAKYLRLERVKFRNPQPGRLELTERGRRATGLWPDQDAQADALIELLNQAADTTTDEDDAGSLRKAGRLLRGVPAAVLADVTAALIRQQTGL